MKRSVRPTLLISGVVVIALAAGIWLRGQRLMAGVAASRDRGDHVLDPFGQQANALVALVPLLPAGLAAGALLDHRRRG